MYILKNALLSISRSKGRNILIGLIIFVIAASACVALSIREAAQKAREDSLDGLEITAQITVNRQNMMSQNEDKESMKEALSNLQGLSLDEMVNYADSDYVKDFYYSSSISVNGNDAIEPVDTTGTDDSTSDTEDSMESDTDSNIPTGEMPGGSRQAEQSGALSGGMGRMGNQGEFTMTGYSSDSAMTDFVDGSESITDGEMFAENDTSGQCIINQELATYNGLAVGDKITLVNPNKEEETYTLTISGIYESNKTEDSSGSMMGGFSASFDQANQIYTSYENIKAITDASSENADVTTDETTKEETTTALQSQTTGTYAFADTAAYEKFKEDTEAKLGDNYSVTSNDLTQYEQSLLPLENLSKYAGYFLLIILVIGGVILAVLNIFNIRERKYEIGVLAAIGMKKWKIAMQFIIELLCVTFAVIIIGAGVGAAASVPVTNKLLEQQLQSTSSSEKQQSENFGRAPGMQGQDEESIQSNNQNSNYITQISSATNVTVIFELIGIGILLTIISGCVAVISILRYDPLRILSNRD